MLRLFILFALAQCVVAQITWNGLKFKTSEDDVKKQMLAQGFELHPVANNQGHYTATPDFLLTLPDLIIKLPFKPELTFGSAGMQTITLSLNTLKLLADNPKLNSLEVTLVSAKSIHDALVTKYGPPLEQSGPCNKVDSLTLEGFDEHYRPLPRETVACITKWRGEAQLITVSWFFDRDEKKLTYILQYQSQANGL